jgi:hypothetical protein
VVAQAAAEQVQRVLIHLLVVLVHQQVMVVMVALVQHG